MKGAKNVVGGMKPALLACRNGTTYYGLTSADLGPGIGAARRRIVSYQIGKATVAYYFKTI